MKLSPKKSWPSNSGKPVVFEPGENSWVNVDVPPHDPHVCGPRPPSAIFHETNWGRECQGVWDKAKSPSSSTITYIFHRRRQVPIANNPNPFARFSSKAGALAGYYDARVFCPMNPGAMPHRISTPPNQRTKGVCHKPAAGRKVISPPPATFLLGT